MANFNITRLKPARVNVSPIEFSPKSDFASSWEKPFNVKGLVDDNEEVKEDEFDSLWSTFDDQDGEDHLDDIYDENFAQDKVEDDKFNKIQSVLFGEDGDDKMEDEEMDFDGGHSGNAHEDSFDVLEETFTLPEAENSLADHEESFDLDETMDINNMSVLEHEKSMLGLDETLTDEQEESMLGLDDTLMDESDDSFINESLNTSTKDIEKNLRDIFGVEHVEEDVDQMAYLVLKKKCYTVSEKEEDVVDNSLMMTLPPEVLLIILTNLNPKDLCSVALVNKRMNILASDSSLWKSIAFGESPDDGIMVVSETKLGTDGWRSFSKCSRFKMVTSVNVKLSQLRIFKTQQRMVILKGILKFNNLISLKMYNDEVNADKSFANIPMDIFSKEIVNIETLDLSKSSVTATQINAILGPVSNQGKVNKLKELNVSGNNLQEVDREVLKKVVHLKKVNLSQTNLTPWQIYDIMTEIFDNPKSLTINELNFSGNDLLEIPPDLLSSLVLKLKINLQNTNLSSDQIAKVLEKVMNYPGPALLSGSEIWGIIGENDLKGVPLYLLYELQKLVANEVGKIEKVLKTRTIQPKSKSKSKKGKGKSKPKPPVKGEGKKELLVRWMYWPEEFDSWIPAEFVYTKICNTAGKFQCLHCPKTYVSNAVLRKHVEKTHEGAPLPENMVYCEVCGKRFSRRATYTKHIKVHDGYAFQCNDCPTEFKNATELKEHQKSHQVQKNAQKNNTKFECCDVCGKNFKSKKSMYQHKSVHMSADVGKLEVK